METTLIGYLYNRIQANFLIWKFVMLSKTYWPEKIRIEVFGKELDTRQDECFKCSLTFFTKAFESLYVRKFVDQNTKENIKEMLNGILEEMYKILSSVNWMDDETR